jgi:membrane fusion protein (multidrug efflux system)
MFATAAVSSGPASSLVTIPLAAVSYNPYGTLVYLVHSQTDANGQTQATVTQEFVTTGATRGDQVSILKGVSANDVVVTAGQLKLHNNAAVKIDNSVPVTNDAAPQPQDR